MSDADPNAAAIHCEFADDPEMRELAEMFVEDMVERVADLEQAWSEQDLASLARLAHQIKGASGGYGFPALSDIAASLERAINDCAELDAIRSEFESLVDSCRRATV